MPTSLTIIEQGRIVHAHYEMPWTYTDLSNLMDADRQYRDEVQRTKSGQKVHVLVTIKNINAFPPGVLRGRQSPSLVHPTSGHAAIVTTAPYVRSLANAIFQVAHYDRARFFETTESALAYLREIIANENVLAAENVT